MPKQLLTALLLLAVAGAPLAAEGAPACDGHDQRTLWLKDLYRGDELDVEPFGRHGTVCRRDWQRLSRFFRDRHGHRRTVAPELLRVLAQIQRHLGGRQLHLMSGYRAPDDAQALSSYHQVGRAADVWIDGIENRDLFDYCRTLQGSGEALGCGLYPHGSHVHVDVRSRVTIWVDLSGYGDGAVYVPDPEGWLDAHPDAGRRLAQRQPERERQREPERQPEQRERQRQPQPRSGNRGRSGSRVPRRRGGRRLRESIDSFAGRATPLPSGSGFKGLWRNRRTRTDAERRAILSRRLRRGGGTTPNPKESPT